MSSEKNKLYGLVSAHTGQKFLSYPDILGLCPRLFLANRYGTKWSAWVNKEKVVGRTDTVQYTGNGSDEDQEVAVLRALLDHLVKVKGDKVDFKDHRN